MRAIGTIAYVTKGLYDPSVTYKEMDVVLYSGSLWEPKKETTGNAPPETQKNEDGTPASNEWWKLFLPGALGDDYVKKTDLAAAPTETEPGKAGIVIPDGKTIQADENGVITGTPQDFSGTPSQLQSAIASGEVKNGMVGYLDPLSENSLKRGVVKIVDGKPVVYGESGKEENEAVGVYIFEEKETFDAAIADHLIPVGALIVKTYDAIEMAGGPFDAELSTESENAPQNKAVANALSVKASQTEYGMAKICPVDVTDVTEDNGLVLGAKEKNSTVDGTLANKISSLISSLQPVRYDFKASDIVNGELIHSTYCAKFYGGLKLFCIAVQGSIQNSSTILTIPDGFRPEIPVVFAGTGNNALPTVMVIEANGRVFAKNVSQNEVGAFGVTAYM